MTSKNLAKSRQKLFNEERRKNNNEKKISLEKMLLNKNITKIFSDYQIIIDLKEFAGFSPDEEIRTYD